MSKPAGKTLQATTFWGKTGDGEAYHPLLYHMLDVAAVTRGLIEARGVHNLVQKLSTATGLTIQEAADLLCFLSGVHDIGKANPGFQGKNPVQRTRLEQSGLLLCVEAEKHDYHSYLILREYFQTTMGQCRVVASSLAAAIAGHHGRFPQAKPRTGNRISGEQDKQWAEQQVLLLQIVFKLTAPSLSGKDWQHFNIDNALLIQLAGLCSTADWLGSMADFFPPFTLETTPEGYWQMAERQARNALKQTGWQALAPEGESRPFSELFPHIPQMRPLQEVTTEILQENPELVIVEAPMGEGKTEAAFLLADYWRSSRGQRGAYTALPTQATSNQMFERFTSYLRTIAPDVQVDLHLLHGLSMFSEAYAQLKILGLEDDKEEGPVAHSWFQARKRGLLAPYGVGTVDQVLLAVLNTRHGFVRLFALANKTVIFDEVHAYDLYMDVLFERCLEWLRAVGCTVILLSATLPRNRRNQLVSLWADTTQHCEDEYPLITTVAGGIQRMRSFTASSQKVIELVHVPASSTDAWSSLINQVVDKGCAAVICNTVNSAHQAYTELKAMACGTGIQVHLLHARYLVRDRQDIERRVLSMFGRNSDNRPKSAILVATQIIEQSLDVDFDLMVTEPAPADLILQRTGRLHRHPERIRPPQLSTPKLWLISPDITDSDKPVFGNSQYVYSYTRLLRSWAALREKASIETPRDIPLLVEAVYGDASLVEIGGDTDWQPVYQKHLEIEAAEAERMTILAKGALIPPPDSPDPITIDVTADLSEDNPEVHQDFRAATRAGKPAVTTVFLHGNDQDVLSFDSAGLNQIDITLQPSFSVTRQLIQNSCTLSSAQIYHTLIGMEVPAAWKANALLRYARLIILNDGSAEVGRCTLTLDPELGIVMEKQPDE